MSITIETIENAQKDTLKLHCADCKKVLKFEEEGLERLTDEDLLLFVGLAELHVERHPQHNPIVYQRKRSELLNIEVKI